MKNSKIMAFIIALGVYGVFIFVSLTEEKEFNVLTPEVLDSGNYAVVVQDETISLAPASEESIYRFHNISYYDDIYYASNQDTEIKNDIISLWEWLFYFSIKELWKTYQIWDSYLNVSNKTPGNFILDTRDPAKYLLYSFDSVLNVEILNSSTWEVATSFEMFPHTAFKMNTKHNWALIWADLFRIDIINKISYIHESLLSDSWKINVDFLSSVWYSRDLDAIKFLNFILKRKKSDEEVSDYKKLQDLSIGKPLAISFINKYFSFFYNDEKKKIFYKNLILEEIHDLFAKRPDEFNKKELSDTIEHFKALKSLSLVDYEEMYGVLSYYYKTVVMKNNVDLLPLKESYAYIFASLDSKKYIVDTNLVKINSLYNSYDNNLASDEDLYAGFSSYINGKYYDNKGLFREWIDHRDLVWLSYSLKNLLKNSILLDNHDFASVFASYLELNNLILVSSENKKTTWATYVYVYSELIPEFKKNIKLYYFNDSDKDLLDPKRDFDEDIYSKLKKLIVWENRLIWFFESNLSSVTADFNDVKNDIKDINMMYLAIDDYSTYKKEYDESLKEIFDIEVASYWEQELDNSMSYKNFKKYIDQFQNVRFFQYNLTLDEENSRYIVKNMKVWDKLMDFFLYPYKNNLISDIKVWGEDFKWLFYLDLEKEKWDVKYESASDIEEKEKYDFTNYFYLTFVKEKEFSSWWEIYEVKDEWFEYDIAEFKFINDKLLSKATWEFRKVNWNIINLNIENILLEKEGNGYNITIKDSVISYMSETAERFDGYLTSKYEFSNTAHNFVDLSLDLYNIDVRTRDTEPRYLWSTVQLIWKISIYDFDQRISNIFDSFDPFDFIFKRTKSDILEIKEISYNLSSNSFTYKYLSKASDVVHIEINEQWYVTFYQRWNDNKVSDPISYKLFKL